MQFHSILFDRPGDGVRVDHSDVPESFSDLNLDQIVDSIVGGRQEYNLAPFFYAPLRDIEAIEYRHEVLRDLEKPDVVDAVRQFASDMRATRSHLALAGKLGYKYPEEGWFLEAVGTYRNAVRSFDDALARLSLSSRGFLAFRDYLADYVASDRFDTLGTETRKLEEDLGRIRYCVRIKGKRVKVSKYDGEIDYSAEVEETFAKFKRGAPKDYRVEFREGLGVNHVEAHILDLVARLYPDTFRELDDYFNRQQDFLDAKVVEFDREVQFYVAVLEFIEPLVKAGLSFCNPEVSAQSKAIYALDAFDLALANKRVRTNDEVVCNDFSLTGPERIIVVTGPNQGGKTTFARMFGQLHHLAGLGCPVPARQARLFLPDMVFAHFEREEHIETLRGKLADELVRFHDILGRATSNSVLIMNETFNSTTLEDARFLGEEILRQIVELDLLCVYVTFIDELASLSEATVSMVATVDPDDPSVRTYEIVRRPADGLAYATAIAERYGLTYDRLKERVAC
ncbi:MAG: DNA mismatch repair protein MutS [Acidimicrobiia bacterium]|nr:MAG: DNA mismatch repair protein MutS [Acidimicrobiia bacterium]